MSLGSPHNETAALKTDQLAPYPNQSWLGPTQGRALSKALERTRFTSEGISCVGRTQFKSSQRCRSLKGETRSLLRRRRRGVIPQRGRRLQKSTSGRCTLWRRNHSAKPFQIHGAFSFVPALHREPVPSILECFTSAIGDAVPHR